MLGVRGRPWDGVRGVGRDLLPVGRQRSLLTKARDTSEFCIQFNSNIYLHEAFKNTYLTALIQDWEVKEKASAFQIGTLHSFWQCAMVFSLNLQYYSLLKESVF